MEKCESGENCSTEEQCRSCGKHDCSCNYGMDRMAVMMCLAKEAKMELLKEKVKRKIEATEGKRLDKIAELLVEAMLSHYKTKMNITKRKEEMKEKFEAIFSEE